MTSLFLVFGLLVLFQVKHFLADYVFQNKYMLGKFLPGFDFVLPLTAHCLVHSIFTLSIVLAINVNLWWLALLDFVLHFMMDRIKASPNFLGRWKITQKAFWVSLGFDQSFHHLTHYFIIWMLVT